MVAQRAVPNAAKTLLINEDKPQICGDCRGVLDRLAGANVVGHPLQALKEIQSKAMDQTNQSDDAEGDPNGNALDRLQLHCGQENKKTRATQGCSGWFKEAVRLAPASPVRLSVTRYLPWLEKRSKWCGPP